MITVFLMMLSQIGFMVFGTMLVVSVCCKIAKTQQDFIVCLLVFILVFMLGVTWTIGNKNDCDKYKAQVIEQIQKEK